MNAPLKITRPAMRYHGAKFRLAPWVMSFFPEHRVYTESFGGAAGVLLQKPRAHAEVYNDLDGDVVNFFRVLRDPELFPLLLKAVTLTPYARDEFDIAWEPCSDPVERARRIVIRAQMGFGSAGATKGSTGLRTDTMRAYTTSQMDWAAYPESLLATAERFQTVLIENRPAVEVMLQHDGPETLHFVDPPYVHSTRKLRSQGGYRHEMTDDDHVELLAALANLKGMVVLSGYASDIYTDALKGWKLHKKNSRISAGRGTTLREESLWTNPACHDALQSATGGLFASAA